MFIYKFAFGFETCKRRAHITSHLSVDAKATEQSKSDTANLQLLQNLALKASCGEPPDARRWPRTV